MGTLIRIEMAGVRTSPDGTAAKEKPSNERETVVLPADSLVELLGDEHIRQILEMIAEDSMGGREMAEAASLSRPTVYRRLNELEDAGLVETTMAVCSEGHHHKEYSAVLETANLELNGDGLTATVRTGGNAAAAGHDTENWSHVDD